MIPVLPPEAETEILLAKVRPQIAALAIAVDLDHVGRRLRLLSLLQIALLLILLPVLCVGGPILLGDANPFWTWILVVPILLLLGNTILNMFSSGDFRQSVHAASTHLQANLDALLEAGRAMPQTALPGTDDFLLRFDNQGRIHIVAAAGSRHARLRLCETLVSDGLPNPWAAWVRRARPAALIRHQGHLLALTEDGLAAFRPDPKNRPT
jgi:hypothetical protein